MKKQISLTLDETLHKYLIVEAAKHTIETNTVVTVPMACESIIKKYFESRSASKSASDIESENIKVLKQISSNKGKDPFDFNFPDSI